MPVSPASVSTSGTMPNLSATYYGAKKPKPRKAKKPKKVK
jgi:hypothetical protein